MNPAPWRVLRAATHRRMPWKNGLGVTTEIAIGPSGATLEDFAWRLSMARIEAAVDFSLFTGVERVLTVLEGTLELSIGSETPRTLRADGRAVRFAGDTPARARLQRPVARDGFPAVVDLNLMVRKGPLVPHLTRQIVAREMWLVLPAEMTAIVCRSPHLRVADGPYEESLELNDVLLLEGAERAPIRLSSEPRGVAYVAELIRRSVPPAGLPPATGGVR